MSPERDYIMEQGSGVAGRYVLITACKNESAFVEELVACIDAQTTKPIAWVIVDDGSSDDTALRARTRTASLPYTQVVQMAGNRPRSFASQVFAAKYGYDIVRALDFEFVGFLDADIRITAAYYECLLNECRRDPIIGVCGGALFDEHAGSLSYVRAGSENFHVPGGIQFFRRQCYDEIGGYVPIEGGGQDSVADVMALMRGWKVRVISACQATHLRPDGAGSASPFEQGLAAGRKYYNLGYGAAYLLAHCLRRSSNRPSMSLATWIGFAKATLQRPPRPVSDEFVGFQRRLQHRRLARALRPANPAATTTKGARDSQC